MKNTNVTTLRIKSWNVHGLFPKLNGCSYSKLDNPIFWDMLKDEDIFALSETWHTKNDVDKLESQVTDAILYADLGTTQLKVDQVEVLRFTSRIVLDLELVNVQLIALKTFFLK